MYSTIREPSGCLFSITFRPALPRGRITGSHRYAADLRSGYFVTRGRCSKPETNRSRRLKHKLLLFFLNARDGFAMVANKVLERIDFLGAFGGLWFGIAAKDALSAAFGWATIVNVAALVYVGQKLGFSVSAGQGWNQVLFYAAICFSVGVAIAFVVNLAFVSHVKAYRELRPLALGIRDDLRSPDFVFNNAVRGYNASVTVTNRSSRHLLDCVVHILNAPQADGAIGQRFVEKFDLPPKSTRTISIAYWFSRQPPNGDDPTVNLSGPVAAAFGGNRSAVSSGSVLQVRVVALDVLTKHIGCTVCIDNKQRLLKATAIKLNVLPAV
jgi:hypothetical protein